MNEHNRITEAQPVMARLAAHPNQGCNVFFAKISKETTDQKTGHETRKVTQGGKTRSSERTRNTVRTQGLKLCAGTSKAWSLF